MKRGLDSVACCVHYKYQYQTCVQQSHFLFMQGGQVMGWVWGCSRAAAWQINIIAPPPLKPAKLERKQSPQYVRISLLKILSS